METSWSGKRYSEKNGMSRFRYSWRKRQQHSWLEIGD